MFNTCILLSTYNGERYLREQLDSLLLQQADIIIRDDGSNDNTLGIITDFCNRFPDRVKILETTGNMGVAMSFITLLRYAVSQAYDYCFFCDQDDVWLPEKCARALQKIGTADAPALYFSRKKIVDGDLRPMDALDRVSYRGDFWDCFAYSNVYGCTMCLNKPLAELAIKNDYTGKRYLHDAFIYRMAITVGATVIYDDWESLLYRQHGGNVVGTVGSKGIGDKISKDTGKKRKHYMQEMMRDILGSCGAQLPEKTGKIVNMVSCYNKDGKTKLALLKEVAFSNANPALKAKLIVKIAGDIL